VRREIQRQAPKDVKAPLKGGRWLRLKNAVDLTEAEQAKLEKELVKVRDRQEGRQLATKKAGTTAKKPPKDTQNGQTDGAKANP